MLVEFIDTLIPQGRFDEQIGHYRTRLREACEMIIDLQREISDLNADVQKARLDNHYLIERTVTRTTAEEARQAAFRLARGKAEIIAAGRDGVTMLSEEISRIPDPKPLFTK